MILDDLNRYYEMKSRDPESGIAQYGWSIEKISWEFRIDGSGQLVSVIPLGSDDGKKKFVPMRVPVHGSRTSAPKPFLLCDNASYFLGIERDKDGQGYHFDSRKQLLSHELHHKYLDNVEDEAARAVLAFFEDDDNKLRVDDQIRSELAAGGFIVFRYLPDNSLVHERPQIVDAWQSSLAHGEGKETIQCAITGEIAEPASLFPLLTGVPGAQSSGASLISFNNEAFCSYGKKSNDKARNASISDVAAFNVGTALRYLMQSPDHHMSLADSQILYWTDEYEKETSECLSMLFDMDKQIREAKEDKALLQNLQQRLERIRSGKRAFSIDPKTRYYILCLSPNAARLSVRFFETGTFGDLEKAFQQYLSDIEIIGRNGKSDRPRSVKAYVYQTAAFGEAKNVPKVLISATVISLLRNRAFPQALYNLLLQRTRVDKGMSGSGGSRYDAMPMRAAMLKACLLRRARQRNDKELERSLTVALNNENRNVGYLLGRLFALLEKAQREAVPDANATIRDRYIGSASSTPARVFPQLLKMAQHHISKAKFGAVTDKRIQETMSLVDSVEGFPATLSYDDQGQFFIGYYQQKADFFAPKNNADDSAADKEE